MSKNAKRQNYQEIEAKTHQSTATAKVVALHPDRQPPETTPETIATEVQPVETHIPHFILKYGKIQKKNCSKSGLKN